MMGRDTNVLYPVTYFNVTGYVKSKRSWQYPTYYKLASKRRDAKTLAWDNRWYNQNAKSLLHFKSSSRYWESANAPGMRVTLDANMIALLTELSADLLFTKIISSHVCSTFQTRYTSRGICDFDEWIWAILSNFLQPSTSLSTSEAAQKLDDLSLRKDKDPKRREDYFTYISTIFELMMHISQQIPQGHESLQKLVDLAVALHSMPPILAPMYPSSKGFREDRSPPTTEEIAGWYGKNAFLARLWKAVGNSPIPGLDFWKYMGWSLRSTLEGGPRREEDRKTDGALDADMEIAATIIEEVGALIYKACHGKDGGSLVAERELKGGWLYAGLKGCVTSIGHFGRGGSVILAGRRA
ncbi:hypothetical protein G7Y89_g6991 [Cudoniella acicularis]|uniref:Uncharacterized protein n=1 Tax=Cudoniella acicularis TaxID=354080 RepID=A0A8H4RJD8_9HELO|nr:hypothetical protein G7Y89_g6991 [Cudoniella acicularis]